MCQFEIVLTFCVCPIQIGGGGFSAKYNSATKRFYCAALCLFASPARVEKTNLSGLHPNVNKASAFKAEIFRLDTGWLFKLPPPSLFSTKMKNGERANQRLSQMKDFMEQQLRLALWHVFISALKKSPCTSFHSWFSAEQSCNSFQSVSQLRNMALSTAEYSISPASLS